MLKSKIILFVVFLSIIATSCAKRGTITGGSKDTIAPKIVSSLPKNFSTNFKGDFIKINFDEFIKIKDISKQLIISPPMKNPPTIVPMGSASKFITIKIQDTLQANTTYSFNFGQSITDNNEGNPYSQFKYVFSTGSYIDSLKLAGTIKDSYSKKPDNFVNVMLYEAETYNDSTVYKKQPRYVTNTLDSIKAFALENIKPGKYRLIALKDKNNNYKFEPQEDKIGFLKHEITIPTDTLYQLELFKEKSVFKASKPSQASSNRLLMGFEGNPKNTKITVRKGSEIIPSKLTRFAGKDSLQIWIPKIKTDSVHVEVTNGNYAKTFTSRIKEMKAVDTLSIETKQKGILHFRDIFTLTTAIPLSKVDASKISVTKKDSTKVPFTAEYKEMEEEIALDFKKEENQKYNIRLLPGAIKDFYDKENDSLKFSVITKNLSDYGNLKITLHNVKRFPIILELLDAKEKVLVSAYSEKETILNFDSLEPQKYTVRVIYDDNKDGEWTTGSFLEKRQAEEVVYYPTVIDLHANWIMDEDFDLKR
ncbi:MULTISPECIES: Ig-like domain-containing protein [Flavobacterium]|uniref:Ig-like domain-containing protein n=1 Tax=Flavobacterium TaxID=237 RepID=UPI001FCAB9B6|nr:MULTISPECIES: Ig-like domain-containing protein [Flavobacterium]UOK43309.1 Ig-like domain-containing protein [Flavobacterium enshiense]